jgi:hypothetical protein
MDPVPEEEPAPERVSTLGLVLRAIFFLVIVWVGIRVFGWLVYETLGYLPAAVLSVFAASSLASVFVVRVYERGRLEDIGMGWGTQSTRQFWIGLGAGAVAAAAVTLFAVSLGLATFVKSTEPAMAFGFSKLFYVATLLLFGVVGEELMFRGYAFQLLAGSFGPWPVIPAFGVLFGAAHLWNTEVSSMGIANTALWGILLGFAMWRSGALWLPIGLHFGWNLALPLAGTKLSGITLGLSGYELSWSASTWLSGGAYGVEASVLTSAACLAMLAWLWRSRIERQPSLLLDARKEAAPEPPPPGDAD